MAVYERGPQGPAGPPGKAGSSFYSGSGAPSSLLGKDGDHYFDKTADALYGPKTAGAWGSPDTISGGGGATPGGTVGQTQENDGAGGFAGKAHGAVGSVLRQTGATTSAFGQLDLADADAVTGVLPSANAPSHTGDVSGAHGATSVDKVKGTTITTAGGALAVGAVLRTTAAGTADWGAVNLADTDAVTGTLAIANVATGTAGQFLTVTTGPTNAWGNTATYYGVGTSTLATVGGVRFSSATQTLVAARNVANTADLSLLDLASNVLWVGSDPSFTATKQVTDLRLWMGSSGTGYIGAGSTTVARWTSTAFIVDGEFRIYDSDDTHTYTFSPSNLAASVAVTLPALTSGDTFVFETHTQTLTNKTISGATYVSIGATPAASGDLRLNASGTINVRKADNSADLPFLTVASNAYTIGNASTIVGLSLRANDVTLFGTSSVSVFNTTGSGYAFRVQPSQVGFGQPISGLAADTVPFRLKSAAITKSDATDLTLSAAQYECPILNVSGTPGGNFNLIAPNTADAVFWVRNTTANTCTIKKSGGTGIAIATNKAAQVWHNGTDYVRLTPDA